MTSSPSTRCDSTRRAASWSPTRSRPSSRAPHWSLSARTTSFRSERLLTRWDDNADLTKSTASASLVHGLLDVVVDGHFDAVQSLDDRDRGARGSAVRRPPARQGRPAAQLRAAQEPGPPPPGRAADARGAQHADAPRRRTGARRDGADYQDVYDHVLRATEWTESMRDLVATIVETNLTIQGNRLNVITKKVTSWAAIIAVPTAITGLLRPEPALSRLQPGVGFRRIVGSHRGALCRSLPRLQTQRLV